MKSQIAFSGRFATLVPQVRGNETYLDKMALMISCTQGAVGSKHTSLPSFRVALQNKRVKQSQGSAPGVVLLAEYSLALPGEVMEIHHTALG